jgi:hypothetical protein
MSASPVDPVDATRETVLRAVPVRPGWCDVTKKTVERQAFEPSPKDVTGLSVVRTKYSSPEKVARNRFDELLGLGKPPGIFCVAEISLSACAEEGVAAMPDPLENNPGHALLPALNASIKGKSACKQLQSAVQRAVVKLHGPYEFAAPDGSVEVKLTP